MSRSSNTRVFLITSLVTAGIVAVAACGGDDDNSPVDPGVPDGSSTPDTSQPTADTGTGTPDTSAPPADSGSDAGEEITDGGGLPPEDDAGVDLDAGFDAGPACGTLVPGAYSASSCVSRLALMSGGALTTTTYTLEKVTVQGSVSFCSMTFASYDHRGALKVTASSASAATFEFWDLYKKAGAIARPTSVRYDVDVAATGSSLAFTPKTCEAKPAPAGAMYSVGDAAGKKVLTLRLPYGKGFALYRFVEP